MKKDYKQQINDKEKIRQIFTKGVVRTENNIVQQKQLCCRLKKEQKNAKDKVQRFYGTEEKKSSEGKDNIEQGYYRARKVKII